MADGTGRRTTGEQILVAPAGNGFEMQPVGRDGAATGEVTWVDDLATAVGEREAQGGPRWIWWRTAQIYPPLLAAGVRVGRCHDLAAVTSILNTFAGEPFAPQRAPVRPPPATGQISLFDSPATVTDPRRSDGSDAGADPQDGSDHPDDGGTRSDEEARHDLTGLHERHRDQVSGIAAARRTCPGFGLLVAAESAAWLAAVEMGRTGLPWRVDVHDEVLTALLGPRPRHAGRPQRLQALAEEVSRLLAPQALGPTTVNPDSPAEVLRAFRRQGVQLSSTRAWELRQIDHPAVEPLLRYKELARLHVAHGWHWQDQWVRDGRFRPEYVPGGVVTGRWATSGGGALQIPRAMRTCVRALPGWTLIAADAGQLEPRILAALSGDPGMIAATADPDLYTALARQALGRPEARGEAKIGLLAAMYGARSATAAMSALRRRFPRALDLLEQAARTGQDGGVVRSVLGRTCPPPEPDWQDVPEEAALARARARGRFTRNFIVQASAADWANVLVAGLRRRLAELASDDGHPELVFFQHDEVLVHAPTDLAGQAAEAITMSGREATSLVLGDRGVHIPLVATPIASYAEKN